MTYYRIAGQWYNRPTDDSASTASTLIQRLRDRPAMDYADVIISGCGRVIKGEYSATPKRLMEIRLTAQPLPEASKLQAMYESAQ